MVRIRNSEASRVPTNFVKRWKSKPNPDGTSEIALDVDDYDLATDDEGLEEVLLEL